MSKKTCGLFAIVFAGAERGIDPPIFSLQMTPAESFLNGAYPRSRGATHGAATLAHRYQGLSPLARGNLAKRTVQTPLRGPIPARAGQPVPSLDRDGMTWAYPRSRGATSALGVSAWAPEGLSPLARGNRHRQGCSSSSAGPIPARAGQPNPYASDSSRDKAYPRSRGATGMRSCTGREGSGLSPLARGNPIPAGQSVAQRRAYPRSRGATG